MCAAKMASAPKERRKNSEKRKEKSRDAARCRRSKESEIFTELSQQLPLPESVACQLDKASVMRLAISYLRLREILEPIADVAKSTACSPYDSSVLEALDAVLLVLSAEGEIVFLSDNVGRHLGLNQVDLMGQSVYEYCHPCDHDELKAALLPKPEDLHDLSPQPCHFLMRLRCTLGSKGRGVSVKSASSYKMMQCVGTRVSREVVPKHSPEEEQPSPLPAAVVAKEEEETPATAVPHLPISIIIRERRHFLVCVAQPIPHPSNIEAPLGTHTFLSRHNPSMCFTHVDDRTETFLGYTSEELLGKSVYSYFDPRDVMNLQQDFKTLFAKGQCETGQYRFLAKNGGCVWVLTQATLIYENSSCSKPQCVVCVNYVLSGASGKHEVLAEQQLTSTAVKPKEPEPKLQPLPTAPVAEAAAAAAAEEDDDDESESEDEDDEEQCFSSSTSKIFAPRTADMNKGFLIFADDDSGLTVLREESEPEDLTHLAPRAGDDTIPLEGLPSDVLGDAFSLSDIYGDENKLLPDYALLPPEEDCPLGRKDPFLSYRDDSDPLSSPGSCGTPPSSDGEGRCSSCSDVPSIESPVDRFAGLELKPEGHTDLQDDDFDMRAPYISMHGDDFPLLSPDSVMWGPQDSSPGSSSSRSSLCNSPTFFGTSSSPPRPTLGSLGPNPKSSLAALLVAELPPPSSRSREWTKHRARTNHPRSSGVSGPHRQDLARSARLTHPHQQLHQSVTRGHLTRGLSAANDVRPHAYVTTALEQKMGMPSPPDPPPKRGSTERALGAGQLASPKRMRIDLRGLQLQNKDSVLLNLLVNGEDACHGYLCQTLRYDKRCPPSSPRPAPLLLDEPIPTLQDLSQLDAEVNAPIQQLLTGEDLLSALDQSVPALV
uniref:Hypoxia-inducible factor 1 alpha n=1 Tax=Rhipicephalus appendiculatus TaxID=34631 RepID=A0A131YIW7_RHIAP